MYRKTLSIVVESALENITTNQSEVEEYYKNRTESISDNSDCSEMSFKTKMCSECYRLFRTLNNYENHFCWSRPGVPKLPPLPLDLETTSNIPPPLPPFSIIPRIEENRRQMIAVIQRVSDEMKQTVGIELQIPMKSSLIANVYAILNQFQALFKLFQDRLNNALLWFHMCQFLSFYIHVIRQYNKYFYRQIRATILGFTRYNLYLGHFIGRVQNEKDESVEQIVRKFQ